MSIDFDDPAQILRAFMKARASLEPVDTVTWFYGTVTAMLPDGRASKLLGFEGYNVSRALAVDGGFDLLTREAVLYSDPTTGEILDRWRNPYTDEEVDVVHIWNDPVNQPMRADGPRGPFRPPLRVMGDDVSFGVDLFLAYPSPLPRAEFPANSQSDTYQAAELFGFFAKLSDLEDESIASAPSLVSWTRIAPWLPFMRMADMRGQLVYHGRGAKLARGYAEVPEHIRARVEAHDPAFTRAPDSFTQPNETSWTYYRKLAARGR